MLPLALKSGDNICIIAPSGSMSVVDEKILNNIILYFKKQGIKVIFGKNSNKNRFGTGGTIEERVEDLMEAFQNNNIKGIIPIFGGYHTNQILPYLDYNLIKNNPKFLIGYSDITALNIAIHSKTGLITFNGPGGTQLGHYWPSEYTLESFEELCFSHFNKYTIKPSNSWTEGAWWLNSDTDNRVSHINKGWKSIIEGSAKGISFGGNISTLSLMAGTEYLSIPDKPILFLEECGEYSEGTIIRQLTHLAQIGLFKDAQAILLGRFEKESKINDNFLSEVIINLVGKDIPILFNVDFGHTEPLFTFPIGMKCEINTIDQTIIFDLN